MQTRIYSVPRVPKLPSVGYSIARKICWNEPLRVAHWMDFKLSRGRYYARANVAMKSDKSLEPNCFHTDMRNRDASHVLINRYIYYTLCICDCLCWDVLQHCTPCSFSSPFTTSTNTTTTTNQRTIL